VEWCYGVMMPLSAQDLASVFIPFFESSPVAPTNDVKFDILFAEDNLVYQIIKILLKYGHTVEIAENGSLAVDVFKARATQNRPFDIILVRMASLCSCVPEVNRLLYPTRRR
jgi:osomolarity two-component system sensor histidine kinase NIK1